MERTAVETRVRQRNAGFFAVFALDPVVEGARIGVTCRACGGIALAAVEVLACTGSFRCPHCRAASGCD